MDIILLRHAKAEKRLPELADEERSLTPEGRKQARAVAKGLALLLKKANSIEIWTSQAKRAEQTAAILGKKLNTIKPIEKPAIYSGCLDELSSQWSKTTADVIVIVGHEPYLSIWTRQLVGVRLPFKKCAAAGFSIKQPDKATLKWFASPKVLAKLGAK